MPHIEENMYAEIINKSSGAYICLKKIMSTNVDFSATYMNQTFENVFQIAKDRLEGVLFSTLLDEIRFDKKELLNSAQSVEQDGISYKDILYSNTFKKFFYVSIIKVCEGTITCLFLDITAFKEYMQKYNCLDSKISENSLMNQSISATQEQVDENIEIYKYILEHEYMAYFDSNTKSYNRNFFVDFLSKAIEKAKVESKIVQVMYIDIDNFKKINDLAGFTIGDKVIQQFSEILFQYESQNIKIGRLCDDEFVIAIYDAEDDFASEKLYESIIKHLDKPVLIDDNNVFYLTISVGVAKYPEGGQTADELIKCADIAMFNVKGNGKSSLIVFEEKMLDEFMQNANFEHRLRNAVENGDFYLCFQPQYESNSKKLRGAEALIRWKVSNDEVISPNVFIPMAEETGCIVEIGTWVIKEALEIYSKWKREYQFKGILSINISAIQLKDKNFIDILMFYVDKFEIDSSDIEIEITESIFIGDSVMIGKLLNELRNKGFKISLDDFGTGYSSLSYLKDIPIDTLKIDKSFIDSIIVDSSTSIITSSVIEMVKKLGLETIAEGVETEEQFEYLKNMKCDSIQGYYMGKPMQQDDMLDLIKKESNLYA